MRVIRTAVAYIIAVIVATIFASIFNSHQILAGHKALGADIPMNDQLTTYWSDLLNFTPSYGAMIAIAFAVGFIVAFFLKRILRPLAPIAYPVAGAAAMGALLGGIELAYPGSGAIGGAQSVPGIALQCFAGAIGGTIFMMMRPK